MAIEDFLITFRADTTQAITAIDNLYNHVTRADAALNRALGRPSQIVAPLQQIAQAAPQATQAMQGTFAAMGQLSNVLRRTNLDATGKATQKLASDFILLKKTMTAAQQGGAPVSQSNVDRATRMVEQLGDAAALSKQQVDSLKAALNQQFGSRNLVPPEFRGAPERQARAATAAAGAERTAFGGGFRTSDAELRALATAEQKLLALGRTGADVSQRLDTVAARIREVSAAANQGKSIDALNKKFQALDKTIGRSGGMTRGNIINLRDTLTQLQNLGGTAAGADPRAARMLPIIEAQFRRLPSAIDPSIQSMQRFTAALEAQIQRARTFNLPLPGATTLGKGFDQALQLQARGFDEGARRAQIFADEMNKLPPTFDEVARRFGLHARRIAEGILLYDAIGRAVQGVADEIKLIGDVAREEIRFNVVIGGGGGANFLEELTRVGAATNTQLADLAGVMDTVAFATDRAKTSAEREADALKLMETAGQLTNVTQRDLATETENILGIMNVFGLSVDEVQDALGRIAVMGGGSSRAISEITDVISKAGRAAADSGFDLDLLAAIGEETFKKLLGSMSGSEIGTQLNTIFGVLSKDANQKDIEELTNGLIQFRDAGDQLRPMSDVFLDIFAAIQSGVLDAETAQQVLDKMLPPLNPGAASFLNAIEESIPEALNVVQNAAGATEEDLKSLSDKLVSGPAEQFSAAMIELGGALATIFSEDVTNNMKTFAGIIKSVGGALRTDFGGGVASAVIQFGIFIAVFRTALLLFRTAGAFLLGGRDRFKAIGTAMAEAGAQASGSSTLVDQFGNKIEGAGNKAQTSTGKIKGFIGGVKEMARSLAAPFVLFIAFEVASNLPDIISDAMADLDEAMAGSKIPTDILERARTAASGADIPLFGGIGSEASRLGANIGGADLTETEFKNIQALMDAAVDLQKEGKLTAEVFGLLEQKVLDTNNSEEVLSLTTADLIQVYNDSVKATADGAEGTALWDERKKEFNATSQETAAILSEEAAIAQTLTGLEGARADELERLNEQLRTGVITVDEWSEGNENAASAAEAVAAFIAEYGDNLSVLPGLQEQVAATGQSAADALFNMLTSNPTTIDERIGILEELVERHKETKDELDNNKIELSVETQKLIEDVMKAETVYRTLRKGHSIVKLEIEQNPITPELSLERLKAQLQAALTMYRTLLTAARIASSGAAFNQPGVPASVAGSRAAAAQAGVQNQAAEIEALERAIDELTRATQQNTGATGDLDGGLGDAFDELGRIGPDDPRAGGSAAKEPPQTGIVDIGDLPPSAVAQIVSIARTAQARVVAAGGTVDTDDTTAFFKDAQFQRLVSGLDQRFLQQAIEELTEVERKRLELEQQRLQDVTRSLVTRVGPIQSLVSAPVLSAGGGALTGQGLNADPRLGNFTINVPINWSGMNLQQLQALIFRTISQAWIDAQRGG